MDLSDSNYEEAKLISDIETLQQLIEEEIHWFIKLLNFLNKLNCCFTHKQI